MIREIVKDEEFLKIPSTDLTKEELYVVDDLIDTLKDNLDRCVGMAANMIGYSKNAIVIVQDNKEILSLINPKIIEKKDEYETSEGPGEAGPRAPHTWCLGSAAPPEAASPPAAPCGKFPAQRPEAPG